MSRTLLRLGWGRHRRPDKRLLKAYFGKMTGLSRAQVTRLIAQYCQSGTVQAHYDPPATAWRGRFTAEDCIALAELDSPHDTLSGPAARHLCHRAWALYGDARYERLASISVAHLYKMRNYHINAVDCVTQWQLVACCERISEAFLLPVIGLLLEQFPFQILGFHSDGGSEFVNHDVARLLEKLRIEFTRSRPRHCNDNALVETKNGAVIRKTLGYGHIPQRFAKPINEFYADHLNPYLNLHRPCLYATEFIDPEGRRRRAYKSVDVQTPLEKLSAMPAELVTFKPGISLQSLQTEACRMTDHEADLMGNGKLGSASTARVRVCA